MKRIFYFSIAGGIQRGIIGVAWLDHAIYVFIFEDFCAIES
jgi:hypothetical protein